MYQFYLRIKVEQLDTILFAILTMNDNLFFDKFFSVDYIHTLINVQNTTCEGEI
jgi:hypothetical protein